MDKKAVIDDLVLPDTLVTIDFDIKKPDIARRASAFLRVLASYQKHNSELELQLEQAYNAADLAQQQALIHGLKGAAGNLGMMPLYELAAEQEGWLRQGGSIHEAIFTELLSLLRASLSDAQRIIEANSQPASGVSVDDCLLELLAELQLYLARSEVVEANLLRRILAHRGGSAKLESLCSALQLYDYDDALNLIADLR